MTNATDVQVQAFVNNRVRQHSQAIIALYVALQDDLACIGDIYAAVNQQTPTWVDNRTDGPPHLLTPSDVLAYNTFITDLVAAMSGDGQWPIVRKAGALANPSA